MKLGYLQASHKIKLGLKPVFVWSLRQFWIGYNFAIAKNKISCIINSMNNSINKLDKRS